MPVEIGARFGRLIVVSKDHKHRRNWIWECLCDCGEKKKIRGNNLLSGCTKSCGCFRRENSKFIHMIHGEAQRGNISPEFGIWICMLSRCYDQKDISYPNYGGRGITVRDEWRTSYQSFLVCLLKTIGRRPSKSYTLDRIENNKGYQPGNIRWATWKEQNRNRRNNRLLTIGGIAKTLSEWSEISGLSIQVISSRLKVGLTAEEAVSTSLSLFHSHQRKVK